jgi:diguanylate cyclase (GGDEF)-like protein/PAS domain S-box-containing protein
MAYQFTAYTALYLVGVVLSLVAAGYAYPSRSVSGARWVLCMSLAIAAWCAAVALDFSSVTLSSHILAAQLSCLGATTAPVFFFLFTFEYSGRLRRLPTGLAAVLFVPPVLAMIAGFTNHLHRLVWTSFTPLAGTENVIIYGHGPIYWAITVYSLFLGLIGTTLVVDSAIRSRGIYRIRSLIIFVAALFPWIAELGYSMSPTSLAGLDPSITLSITAALIAIAIARYRLFDLLPLPREILIEEMADGIVVLDPAGRVLETNPAALSLLGLSAAPKAGSPGAEMFSAWSEAGRDAARAVYEDRSTMLESPTGTVLSVDRSTIGLNDGTEKRDLFILRDITAQARAEQELHTAYQTLQSRMAEIERLQAELLEQATRDPLTGLHNRRYLDEELHGELARAGRDGTPVSLLMLDVDHFKEVNDRLGHAAGDDVMRAIAQRLTAMTRTGDITCRLGGDEFVIVMPNTSTEDAANRAEQIRQALARPIEEGTDGGSVQHTVSIGIATYPTHADSMDRLMAAADRGLYEAKNSGRNRVSVLGA